MRDILRQPAITDEQMVVNYIRQGWSYNLAVALTRRMAEVFPEQVIITSRLIDTKRAA